MIDKKNTYTRMTEDGVLVAHAEMWDACMVEVDVISSGFCGGDAGHGGFAHVKIADAGSFYLVDDNLGSDVMSISFSVHGDSEITLLADALWFAAKALRPYSSKHRNKMVKP